MPFNSLAFATYRRDIDPAVFGEMIQAATSLAARHGIPFHDYIPDGRFTLDDFYDNDHLNARGAEKFTRLLLDEAVSPLLGGAPSSRTTAHGAS
jgi:hypothetical protein